MEITDLLWQVDAAGARLPVAKGDVLTRLRQGGQHRAARIVSAIPAGGGILDPDYVDALGVRVHCELQRLGEELQFGRRVAALLSPIIDTMRRDGAGPVRVVDVGCGLGFVVRAMAACSALGPDVELVGVDLNPVLVAEARLPGADVQELPDAGLRDQEVHRPGQEPGSSALVTWAALPAGFPPG